jgi:hypothetical protein
MKGATRTIMALLLAGFTAAPVSAQQTTLQLPHTSAAQKDDEVVVTLRDGREIRGRVGKWMEDVGFYVKPADTPAWLIHPGDIVSMQDAASGRALAPPVLHRGMSRNTKMWIGIGVAAAVGGLLLWAKSPQGLGGG